VDRQEGGEAAVLIAGQPGGDRMPMDGEELSQRQARGRLPGSESVQSVEADPFLRIGFAAQLRVELVRTFSNRRQGFVHPSSLLRQWLAVNRKSYEMRRHWIFPLFISYGALLSPR
jgi:hypothetical protein